MNDMVNGSMVSSEMLAELKGQVDAARSNANAAVEAAASRGLATSATPDIDSDLLPQQNHAAHRAPDAAAETSPAPAAASSPQAAPGFFPDAPELTEYSQDADPDLQVPGVTSLSPAPDHSAASFAFADEGREVEVEDVVAPVDLDLNHVEGLGVAANNAPWAQEIAPAATWPETPTPAAYPAAPPALAHDAAAAAPVLPAAGVAAAVTPASPVETASLAGPVPPVASAPVTAGYDHFAPSQEYSAPPQMWPPAMPAQPAPQQYSPAPGAYVPNQIPALPGRPPQGYPVAPSQYPSQPPQQLYQPQQPQYVQPQYSGMPAGVPVAGPIPAPQAHSLAPQAPPNAVPVEPEHATTPTPLPPRPAPAFGVTNRGGEGDGNQTSRPGIVGASTEGAQFGWRRVVRKVTGYNAGKGRPEIEYDEDVRAINKFLREPKVIGFGALKGGVGKTSMTMSMASTISTHRNQGKVVAIDAGHAGTLKLRAKDVSKISDIRQMAYDPKLRKLDRTSDVEAHLLSNPHGLSILGSSDGHDPLTPAEYLAVLEILKRHYQIIIVDMDNSGANPVMPAVLNSLNALVMVTAHAYDSANRSDLMFDWLRHYGKTDLIADTTVLMNQQSPAKTHLDMDATALHFASLKREEEEDADRNVLGIPWDDHLSEAGPINLDLLQKHTRRQLVRGAARVVGGLNSNG